MQVPLIISTPLLCISFSASLTESNLKIRHPSVENSDIHWNPLVPPLQIWCTDNSVSFISGITTVSSPNGPILPFRDGRNGGPKAPWTVILLHFSKFINLFLLFVPNLEAPVSNNEISFESLYFATFYEEFNSDDLNIFNLSKSSPI